MKKQEIKKLSKGEILKNIDKIASVVIDDFAKANAQLLEDNNISADDFAQSIETISYEIITALSRRIKRVILD